MINLLKIVGEYSLEYPALDETTPWYEFLSYQECCNSLGKKVYLTNFLRYHNYLRELQTNET